MKLDEAVRLGRDSNGLPYLIDYSVIEQKQGTNLNAPLLDVLIQEIYNAIIGFDLTPSSDNTQLYQIIKGMETGSSTVHDAVKNAMAKESDDFNAAMDKAFSDAKASLDQQEADVDQRLKDIYAGLVARIQNSAGTLNGFMQEMVGKPFPWPSDIPPANCLACDGSGFSGTQYPMLAKVYPNLITPDMRGLFIRGANTPGSALNPDNTPVLGVQNDALYLGVDFSASALGYLTTSHAIANWHHWSDQSSPLVKDDADAPSGAITIVSDSMDTQFADQGAWHSHGQETRYNGRLALNFLQNEQIRQATETRPVSTTYQWVVYAGNQFEIDIPDLF